jgi:hypothetical protein
MKLAFLGERLVLTMSACGNWSGMASARDARI